MTDAACPSVSSLSGLTANAWHLEVQTSALLKLSAVDKAALEQAMPGQTVAQAKAIGTYQN